MTSSVWFYTGHIDDEEKEKRPSKLAVSRMELQQKLPANPVIHVQHIEGIADVDFRDPKVF